MDTDYHDDFKRIQLILDCAPMSVTIYNSHQKMVDCNMEAVRLFGFDTKANFIEAFNERFYSFFSEIQPCGTPSMEKVPKMFQTTAKDKRLRLEFTHLAHDGSEMPTDVTMVRIDINYSYMFVVYVRDMRQEKAAQQKERESVEMIKALYDFSPVFIDIWDDKFNLLDCNKRAVELLGIKSKEDFLSRPHDFSPEYQPCGTPSTEKYKSLFSKVLQDGTAKFEWLHIDVNGNDLPVAATYFSVTRSGKTLIVGFNYDLRTVK